MICVKQDWDRLEILNWHRKLAIAGSSKLTNKEGEEDHVKYGYKRWFTEVDITIRFHKRTRGLEKSHQVNPIQPMLTWRPIQNGDDDDDDDDDDALCILVCSSKIQPGSGQRPKEINHWKHSYHNKLCSFIKIAKYQLLTSTTAVDYWHLKVKDTHED